MVATAGAGFKFSPTATVSIGGHRALTAAVAADSSTLTFLPVPGNSGVASVTGGVAGGFALTALPTAVSTFTSPPPYTGTSAFATAPTLAVPALNVTDSVINGTPLGFQSEDFGGASHLYKITLAAPTKIEYGLPTITDGSDLGVYFYNADFSPRSEANDAKGGGTGDAEAPKAITLPAGTYYIAIVYFEYPNPPTPSLSPPQVYVFTMTTRP